MTSASPTYLSPKSPLSLATSPSSTNSSLPPWEWRDTVGTPPPDIALSSNVGTPLEATTPSELAPDRYRKFYIMKFSH
jgi:hypothetical protein